MSDTNNATPARRLRKQTNSAVVKGNLAVKPELRMAGQTPVTTLAVYNSEIVNGVQQTNRLHVVLFGKMAEDAVKYLDQGREVTVVGRLRSRTYDDVNSPEAKKLGEPIRRTRVEIIAREVEWGFDPSRARQAQGEPEATSEPEPAGPTAEEIAAAQAILAAAAPAQASAIQPEPALQADEPPAEAPDVQNDLVAAAATPEDIPF